MLSTYWLGIYTYSLYQAIRKDKGALLDCGRYSKVITRLQPLLERLLDCGRYFNYYSITGDISDFGTEKAKEQVMIEERELQEKRFRYYEYKDLKFADRMIPIPRKCAEYTPGGIPCEYYTVPRMSDLPAGYTAYKIKKYDVSDEKKLVRVGLRLSKYRKPDGQTGTEEIDTFEGKYSFAALKMLHEDFCDPCCTFDLLKKKYPLNKNASMDAYDTLLPWARKNHIFPDYPHDFTHLWFSQLFYKNTKLTFCFTYKKREGLSLIDIIEDNEEEFIRRLSRCKNEKNKYICLPADYELYDKLHKIYPDAVYVFDVFQIAEIIDKCISSNEITKEERFKYEAKKRQLADTLKFLEEKESTWKEAEASCKSVINFLLQDGKRRELDEFKKNIELIIREQSGFIDDFFKIKEYHVFLPNELQSTMEDFLKSRGYNPARLSYMLLAEAGKMQKKSSTNDSDTLRKPGSENIKYEIQGSNIIIKSPTSELISSLYRWKKQVPWWKKLPKEALYIKEGK